jgi:hypothetical protein
LQLEERPSRAVNVTAMVPYLKSSMKNVSRRGEKQV